MCETKGSPSENIYYRNYIYCINRSARAECSWCVKMQWFTSCWCKNSSFRVNCICNKSSCIFWFTKHKRLSIARILCRLYLNYLGFNWPSFQLYFKTNYILKTLTLWSLGATVSGFKIHKYVETRSIIFILVIKDQSVTGTLSSKKVTLLPNDIHKVWKSFKDLIKSKHTFK